MDDDDDDGNFDCGKEMCVGNTFPLAEGESWCCDVMLSHFDAGSGMM